MTLAQQFLELVNNVKTKHDLDKYDLFLRENAVAVSKLSSMAGHDSLSIVFKDCSVYGFGLQWFTMDLTRYDTIF